jgi:hypothetical protein
MATVSPRRSVSDDDDFQLKVPESGRWGYISETCLTNPKLQNGPATPWRCFSPSPYLHPCLVTEDISR